MVKMMTILAGLVLLVGIGTLEAQDTSCENPFTNPDLDESNFCDHVEESVKCMIQENGLAEDGDPPEEFLEALQERLEFSLASIGFTCDFDVDDIFEELIGQEEPKSTPSDCVDDASDDQCKDRPSGDYPICDSSKCANGKYITCSNGILYVRNCPGGWYRENKGRRFVAPTVYNPAFRACDFRSPACPRDLDNLVEN